MPKYKYAEGAREISGFGGGYEEACRNMVIRGMEWFDENPSASPKFKQYQNVFGIINEENPEAKSLTDTMLEVVGCDCTGAMMQASVNHVMYAAKNGWEKYMEEMTKPKDE
jgi:hypothetical protein